MNDFSREFEGQFANRIVSIPKEKWFMEVLSDGHCRFTAKDIGTPIIVSASYYEESDSGNRHEGFSILLDGKEMNRYGGIGNGVYHALQKQFDIERRLVLEEREAQKLREEAAKQERQRQAEQSLLDSIPDFAPHDTGTSGDTPVSGAACGPARGWPEGGNASSMPWGKSRWQGDVIRVATKIVASIAIAFAGLFGTGLWVHSDQPCIQLIPLFISAAAILLIFRAYGCAIAVAICWLVLSLPFFFPLR